MFEEKKAIYVYYVLLLKGKEIIKLGISEKKKKKHLPRCEL
jgi:hypothetical protein